MRRCADSWADFAARFDAGAGASAGATAMLPQRPGFDFAAVFSNLRQAAG